MLAPSVRQLLESSPPAPALFVSEAGLVEWCNRSASELCGRPAAELLGTPFSAHCRRDLEAEGNEVFVTGPTGTGELRCRVTSVHVNSKEMAGELIFLEPLSVPESPPPDPQPSSLDLDRVGRFAAGLAHDFNNLLSVIVGHTELAQARRPDAATADCLERIRAAADHAGELVKRLLTIDERPRHTDAVVDLNEASRAVSRLLERVLSPGIALEVDLWTDPAETVADGAQMEQALLNLCFNSRDAIGDAPGTIRIQTRIEPADGSRAKEWCVLSITDDGDGMPEEVLRRALEPHFSTKGGQPGTGTGMGLAMVAATVHEAGGDIEVRSRETEGTEVRLLLPRHVEPSTSWVDSLPALLPSGHTSHDHAPGGATSQARRILVAEDTEDVCDVICRVLEQAGYAVFAARDGAEAVERYREMHEVIDLVLLDALMPRMSGIEAMREIRKQSPDVAVLFTTGYQVSELSPEFLEQNGAELVRKPWSPDAMLSAVRRALDSSDLPRFQ